MRWNAIVIATVVAVTPACTVLSMGAGAGVAGIHNATVDEPDEWDYSVPMLTGAAVGLVVDIALLYFLKRQWSKPMT